MVQGLLQNLGRVENQLDVLTTKARGSGSMGSKIGGLGESLLMGFGIGGGMAIFDTALGAIRNFIGNASAEFEDAERAAIELERALGNIGKGNLLVGLQNEATQLAEKFGGLFDNDDIVKAQTQLVQYGKVSREELSKLLPVILGVIICPTCGPCNRHTNGHKHTRRPGRSNPERLRGKCKRG